MNIFLLLSQSPATLLECLLLKLPCFRKFLLFKIIFNINVVFVILAEPLTPSSSPILGSNVNKFINISESLANGEIGFFSSPITLLVTEPSDEEGSRNLKLILMRDGTQNEAIVEWRINSDNEHFVRNDVRDMQGSVKFDKGLFFIIYGIKKHQQIDSSYNS